MIPDWMKEVEIGPCQCCTVSIRKKDFIRKTLDGILTFFQGTLVSETYSKRDGLLQSIDPRIKLISILSLVVAVCLTRNILVLAFVYLLTLVFAISSKIEVSFFIKRVWLFIPIFAGIIMLPVLFNVFYPGDSLITLITLGPGAHLGPFDLPSTISITYQGLLMAGTFILRVAVSVSAVVLLFLTTRPESLFKSLRSVGVPKIYVLTLDMCYRYIFLFMDVVRDLYTAKKSRTVKISSLWEEQKWVGGRIGFTLIKSLNLSEKVHEAMISRGFNGDVKIMQDFRLRHRDYCALVIVPAFSVLLVLISYNIINL